MRKVIKTITDKIQQAKEKKEAEKKNKTDFYNIVVSEDPVVHRVEVKVSIATMIKIVFVIALAFGLLAIFEKISSILIMTFVAFFLSLGLSPILNKLESFHIPRALAILLLYILFFGALTVLFVAIIPIVAEQIISISADLRTRLADPNIQNSFWYQWMKTVHFDPEVIRGLIAQNLNQIAGNLSQIAGSTFGFLVGVFSGIFNLIFTLVLMFFILLERESIGAFFLSLFPQKNREYVRTRFENMQIKMSEWFHGQLTLMVCMGLMMYVGMKILEWTFGMPYAATIGLLAAFMELFPYIGVIITGILATLIAVNVSWFLVILVIGWIALVQFLEGNILVPTIMEKAVGMSSVAVILALACGGAIGYSIGGVSMMILGMVLAIPFTASISIFIEEYAQKEKK